MDGSPPNPTAVQPPTPTRQPQATPSRAIRAGAGMSAAGGLGAAVGFFLPWFIFLAVVQICRAPAQVQVVSISGAELALAVFAKSPAALVIAALAIATFLCAILIMIMATRSVRKPVLFDIRLLLAASLVGLSAVGVLGALATSVGGDVKAFLGFAPGFWVTTGGLALALVGGAALHAAARTRRQRAPIGEIVLASLGIVGLLGSTVAAVAHPASNSSSNSAFTCAQQGNAGLSSDGAIYITSADSVYAIDAASGRLDWRCRNPVGGVVTEGAPALADGVLFVASRDGYVYAIRADNAAILWRADVGGREPYAWQASHGAPIVGDGLVFGINGSGQVYALRESDGARAWTSIWKAVRWTTPTLLQADGALVYYADDGGIHHLIALDERTGMSMWKSQDNITTPSYPTVGVSMMADNGVVYDVEKSDEVYLVARSVRDGVTLWRHFLSPLGSQEVMSGFTVADGVVYLDQRNESGPMVEALRASDGAVIWSTPAPDVVSASVSQMAPAYSR